MPTNNSNLRLVPRTASPYHNRSDGITDNILELQEILDGQPSARTCEPLGCSPAMRSVVALARRFANSSATILLSGESGTGKEVVARFVHESSSRAHCPYIRVNCAALPESLMESELFGHERGAFTGAVQARRGRLAAAEQGTILLDEISEIPLSMQAKLLRVLEEEEFQPLGSETTMRFSARVIATTNRRLEDEVQAGRFREDLYYRLNILHIDLPPLRDRPDDIDLLVAHFIQHFRGEATLPILGVCDEAYALLRECHWAGNVRQLRNTIHRACVISQSERLTPADLRLTDAHGVTSNGARSTAKLETMTLEDAERYLILRAISRHGGNKTAAAQELDVTARTLANKLKKYAQQCPEPAAFDPPVAKAA